MVWHDKPYLNARYARLLDTRVAVTA